MFSVQVRDVRQQQRRGGVSREVVRAACSVFDAAIEAGARSGRAYSYRAASSLALGDVAGARADCELARRAASDAERQEIETNYQTFLARTDIE